MLFIISIMILALQIDEGCQYLTKEDNIYIREYAIKVPGRAPFVFIEIKDSIAYAIGYDIFFDKTKILKVKKFEYKWNYEYIKDSTGNVFIDKLNEIFYSKKTFSERRIHPDKFYKLIAPDFLNVDNRKRMEILEEYVKKNKD